MKFINKKIPLGLALAIAFIASAIVYSISYGIAMNKFNSIMSYNNEKQQMYSKLSEVDTLIRQEYIGEINELNLSDSICQGYISGLQSDSCKFLTKDEYRAFLSQKNSENPISYQMIYQNIGYIKFQAISESAGNSFINAVKSLQSEGASAFVFDLRNVNSGEIDSVEKVLDIILPEGQTLFAIDKKGDKQEVYRTVSSGIQMPMALLVNSQTSGMAEVIAMAVKGKDNVKIVGNTTKGCAFKNREVQIFDGSAIIFPVAFYSVGDNITKFNQGISPDVEASLDDHSFQLLLNSQLNIDDDVQIKSAVSSIMS